MNSHRPIIILLRGGPASGKTTVGRLIRDSLPQAISIPFNIFHRFFSRIPTQNKDLTFEAVLMITEFFLKKGFSVIVEELFIFPKRIEPFFELGSRHQIPTFLFELKVSTEEAIKRYELRGIKTDRKNIQRILDLLADHPDPRAQKIDTRQYSPEEIKNLVLQFVRKESE